METEQKTLMIAEKRNGKREGNTKLRRENQQNTKRKKIQSGQEIEITVKERERKKIREENQDKRNG